MVDELSEMSMVDPISGTEIALPSITTHPDVTPKHDKHGRIEIYNIVWSGDPDDDDWAVWRAKMLYYNKAIFCRDIDIVAVIDFFGRGISITRAGDDRRRWTRLEFPSNTLFTDLMYHEGRLYVFNDGDHVAVFDDLPSRIRRGSDTDQSPTRILGTLSMEWYGNKRYIVMSSLGRLLRVYRRWRRDETIVFEVFGVDGVQVKNIGDCALFLGVNHSLCLPVEGVSGAKKNCIYFTHDNYEAIFVDRHSVRDLGVFNIEDGTIERYFHKQQCIFPPPLWFMPNLP
ncbi:hypothetical protein QJS04_geneDACA009775 [Acorus gramineus]|uniref:KIB1-4 beta-propeller domain-containing protein n=1 Tax=Acorus gramineus TaxID=55184 RepID=A0AAV9B7Q7_ACOGR|nr:hypothetical protein QJS04_geneDACA009775 [Acorus gramineus]